MLLETHYSISIQKKNARKSAKAENGRSLRNGLTLHRACYEAVLNAFAQEHVHDQGGDGGDG